MLKRKILAFVLILSFVTPFFYLPRHAPKAEAVFGFGDLVIDIKALAERIVDGIGMALAQQIVDRMVASTVKWAQSGFEGNPSYATNPRQFFTNIADGVAGEYIQGSKLGFLCSPFQAQIRISLAQQYYEPEPFQCTVTGIQGNIENFYNDFSNGGWDAWFSITQNPVNNPYGAFIKAKIDLDTQVAKSLGLEKQQLDWNQGFLSWSECLAHEAVFTTPGPGSTSTTSTGLPVSVPGAPLTQSTGRCILRGPTQTPGSTIKAQLDRVLPSGLEKLVTAQHVDQLISAFASGLLQKFVFGPDGLFSNKSNPDQQVVGGPVDMDGDGVPDGLDNTGDGQPDFCFYGGELTVAGPPCLGSASATATTPPPGGGGQCNATGQAYEGALDSAMDAVLAERPDIGNLPNIESGGRQNARTFLALVEEKLVSMGYRATDDVLNGNNNPNTGDLIAVWRDGDDDMERYDSIIGSASTIREAAQTSFTGFVPLNCTASGGGSDCGCSDDGGGTGNPGTEPTSLLEDLQEERDKYPNSFASLCTSPDSLEPEQCPLGKILNAVAWKNKDAGWVLLGKEGGHRCPTPSGKTVSCDFLVHKPTMYGYDVFRDAEGDADPMWSDPDTSVRSQVNSGSRTIVNPVAP